MVNLCKPSINAVSTKEPKMLIGSAQNGKWLDIFLQIENTRIIKPSADRRDLNHPIVSYTEHGKPVSSPKKASGPQGTPLEMQAADIGKSKGRLIMRRIGIERKRHHPTGNRADFRLVFHHEKTYRTS